jgi:eukaryotic-like serine/threonine-protein kinase
MWLALTTNVGSIASRRPRQRRRVLDGRYALGQLIGRGGMGRVFEAEDLHTRSARRRGRSVAVKMLLPSLQGDPEAVKRFSNEALALRSVDHPNVTRLLDSGIANGSPYVVMERLRGPSLCSYVAQHGPMRPRDALVVFRHAARGLAALHEVGVVHRDAKPSNLMLTLVDGRPVAAKWSDLGLAHLADRKITAAGMALGTGAYMAPEQVVGDDVDAATDIYGMAVSLFFALTGQLPFEADARQSMLLQLTSAPPPLSWLIDDVDEELERIVACGLRKNPKNRYVSARAVLEDIECLLGLRDGEVRGAAAVCPDVYQPRSGYGWRVYARACRELRL